MSFSLDVRKFAEKAGQNVGKVRRGVALDLFSSVVLRTPVGDPKYWKTQYRPKGYIGGTLRGNWQVGINGMNDVQLARPDKGGNSTIAAGASMIDVSEGNDDTIYLFNNMPYAMRVEFGWSARQAPAGMVRVSIAEFQAAIDEQLKQLI